MIARTAYHSETNDRRRKHSSSAHNIIGGSERAAAVALALLIGIIIIPSVSALVSVSELGYHPGSVKTATVYTTATSGTFDVLRNGAVVHSGLPLSKAKDLGGTVVECQGGQACLVADFTNVTASGTYVIRATAGGKTESSPSFPINTGVYRSGAQVFNGFFDAQRSIGSTYHANLNGFADPAFVGMADGSFILKAHQAGQTLIRLGNAYRRDPQLIDSAAITTMNGYADYLAALQDAKIQESSGAGAFRLEDWLSPQGAFIPGPTSATTLTIYTEKGAVVDTVPLRSLCAANGTADPACLQFAADYYKCQADEPCVELSYIGKTGTRVPGQTDGLGVDTGWYYSWSCYYDVDLQGGNYNTAPNPCMVYDTAEDDYNTAIALLAWAEAITPINQEDPTKAQALLTRAQQTQAYLKGRPLDSDEKAYFGAASFLLYDMTGNKAYLQDAYAVRGSVESILHHDKMRGSEFYWQEYIRHRNALEGNGMAYNAGVDPENVFNGQMAYDYYNGDAAVKISKNAERVYDAQRTYGFSNSRAILSMSVFASKAIDLTGSAPAYTREIADQQIAWVTGNNAVDTEVSSNTRTMESMSFIFGIGSNPDEFHSRLLQDSGYAAATAGQAVELEGMHGTGLKFMDGATLTYLDGKTTILGNEFGGQGNGRGGETQTPYLDPSKTFKNGRSSIQGWINGPFDVDGDDVFDYDDNRDSFHYTEAENDMVATAFEAFAYADAIHNGIAPLPVPQLEQGGVVIPPGPPGNGTNTTPPVTPPNSTNSTAMLNVKSTPVGADVYVGTVLKGMTGTLGYLQIPLPAGTHTLRINKTGYAPYVESIVLASGQNVTRNITLEVQRNTTGNQTNTTPVPGAPRIVSQGATNITQTGSGYSMPETGVGIFSVEFNQSVRIDWYVNGKLAGTQNGIASSFTWHPTVLYSGGKDGRAAVITASGNGVTNATFNVHVTEVINPFWDATQSADSPWLYVYTQDAAGTYTGLSVVLENGARWAVPLRAAWTEAGETRWEAQISSIRTGTTHIREIIVQDNRTGTTVTYAVTGDRSYYKPGREREGGGGGGGGGGASVNTPPELVFAVFSNDTIPIGAQVTLSADLRDNEEIVNATALIKHDSGSTQLIPLALTNGARGYGTWTTVLTGIKPGKYTLMEIRMVDNSRTNASAYVGDRAFYVLSDEVLSSERLLLVYALLNQSSIMPGERIGVKLDVRDYLGVESVEVTLKSKDREIPVVLERIGGTANYGTWEGSTVLNEADTTYALVTARITNSNETKETRIYGQKVYVQYVKPVETASGEEAANKVDLKQLVRNPVTPLLIGLIGMGLAMLIVSSMTFMKTEK